MCNRHLFNGTCSKTGWIWPSSLKNTGKNFTSTRILDRYATGRWDRMKSPTFLIRYAVLKRLVIVNEKQHSYSICTYEVSTKSLTCVHKQEQIEEIICMICFWTPNSYWKGIQNTSKSTLKSRFWRCAICFLKLFGLCPCVMHCWASVMPAPNVRISSLINITLVGINEIQLVWQTWTKWNPAIVKWGIGWYWYQPRHQLNLRRAFCAQGCVSTNQSILGQGWRMAYLT